MTKTRGDQDRRILIFAPTGRYSELPGKSLAITRWRQKSERGRRVVSAVRSWSGPVFLTGEALIPWPMQCLIETFEHQPTWSDIPILVLTSGGGQTPENVEALAILGKGGM